MSLFPRTINLFPRLGLKSSWYFYPKVAHFVRVGYGLGHSRGLVNTCTIRWHNYSFVAISLLTRQERVELTWSQMLYHSPTKENYMLEGHAWTWNPWYLLKGSSWRACKIMALLVSSKIRCLKGMEKHGTLGINHNYYSYIGKIFD
jgi:hypothetical protein